MFLIKAKEGGKSVWDVCIESVEDIDLFKCIFRQGRNYGLLEARKVIERLEKKDK